MTALLFPDNTVLVNFGLLDRFDLLERLVSTNGRWTGTVSTECARSAREPGLAVLETAPRLFGEPLLLETAKEITDTAALRGRMAGPSDPAWKHLGEAEAVSIISNRGLDAAFVTDDRDARTIAQAEGITTYSTCHLLKLAARVGLISMDDAWQMVAYLRRQCRRLYDSPPERTEYLVWCAA